MSSTDASYYLQEVKTIDGCVLDSKKYDVTFKQTDTRTQLYSKTLKIKQHILNLIKQTLQVIKK